MTYIPDDETIEKTVVLGFREVLKIMGVPPESAEPAQVLEGFHAWLGKKIAESPQGELVRKFGARWDGIESTDEYMEFADDVGVALDVVRGVKRD